MKKLIPVLLLGFSGAALADDTVVYTSDEYCELDKTAISKMDERELKVYAEKLGTKHSKKFCKKVVKENKEKVAERYNAKKNWNYKFGRAERGSVRRLPARTIAKLRAEGIYDINGDEK